MVIPSTSDCAAGASSNVISDMSARLNREVLPSVVLTTRVRTSGAVVCAAIVNAPVRTERASNVLRIMLTVDEFYGCAVDTEYVDSGGFRREIEGGALLGAARDNLTA